MTISVPAAILGRYSTKVGAAVMIIAALAVGRAVTAWLPDDEAASKPFERHAGVGEPLSLRYGDLEVRTVEGGTRLSRTSQVHVSPGLWLVIAMDFTPRQNSSAPAFVEVVGGDGTVMTKSSRNTMQCEPTNPGITARCAIAFEISAAAAPGASLRVAMDNTQWQRYDDLAVINLGIKDVDVARFERVTEPIVFPIDRPEL